uniref:Uncharacterized protein n=1 Tax=Arundo donax TaxID=35708 RepID=A0A0A9DB46_ARUDO
MVHQRQAFTHSSPLQWSVGAKPFACPSPLHGPSQPSLACPSPSCHIKATLYIASSTPPLCQFCSLLRNFHSTIYSY